MNPTKNKLNDYVRALSLGFLFSIGIASITGTRHTDNGDPPGITEPNCTTILFQDNFDTDTVDSTPSISPAGNPADDSLSFSTNGQNYIKVVNSTVFSSRAVRIKRGSSTDLVFHCNAGGGPQSPGIYYIRFKAYSVQEANFVPPMTISIESSSGKKAAELVVDNLQYELKTGSGSQILTRGYVVNNADIIQFTIDMVNKDISVSIDGTSLASDKPFIDAAFEDISQLNFKYPQAILEALGTYDVDDIKICKG